VRVVVADMKNNFHILEQYSSEAVVICDSWNHHASKSTTTTAAAIAAATSEC